MKKIYLLLKQHNKTKLKYLCKRTTNNIKTCYSYVGSGKRWVKHIAKHGYDVTTIILGEFDTIEDFKKASLEFSKKWNIVESKEFANLIPEQGDGGNTWYGPTVNKRRTETSLRMKQFHASTKGTELRNKLSLLNKQTQIGIPMTERMKNKSENWIDPRKGKQFNEIYKQGYTHPQQKPFKIKLENTNKEWICYNESDFHKQLKMYPHPSLTRLKKDGKLVIKHTKLNSKHSFKKGDVLTFKYIDA